MLGMLGLCCGRRRVSGRRVTTTPIIEKTENCYYDDPNATKDEAGLRELQALLLNAEGSLKGLKVVIGDKINEAGWLDDLQALIGEKLYGFLVEVLKARQELSGPLKDAFERSLDEAKHISELARDFAGEHPILTGIVCAVVVLGVLALIWPNIIELLGFRVIGPRAGSFAARWQKWYGGQVPARSLFAFFQRLGMKMA